MINFRIIARIFSLLLIVEGLFMLISTAVSYIYNEPATSSLFYSALITIITGLIVFTPLRNVERISGKKEGYIIIIGAWLFFSLFGTLPYLFSGSVNNFTDAFFESVSGFTTTGATIFYDVESLQHGILFWRSLTQWLGGIGIIFISLYVLPVYKSIYIQLPAVDFSGQPSDKIHPRIKDAARRLIFIYSILTLLEFFLLHIGGMPVFDSVCFSFSTLSTGGFSTLNNGVSAFSPFLLIVITIFMLIAGTNMSFIYFGVKGNWKKILGNNEFFFYSIICVSFMIIGSLILYSKSEISGSRAILEGSLQVISIITTTGFYIQDPATWGNLFLIILFVLMFTGGTSGSTSGGIKIVRLLVITRNSRQELKRLVHPSAFIPVKLDRHIIPQTTIFNLLVYITLYFIIVCSSAFIISYMGFDIITSFSTSASMLGNIGPGLNSSGFFINYSEMPNAGKYFLSALMVLGRLELFTLLMIFTRSFYRN